MVFGAGDVEGAGTSALSLRGSLTMVAALEVSAGSLRVPRLEPTPDHYFR
jgi:hypothetical protein